MRELIKKCIVAAVCTLLTTLLWGCGRTPPQPPQPEVILLGPKESFYQVWAEIISRTEAINKKAKEIAQNENLAPGDFLPPSRIGIRGVSDTYLPRDEPYNILLETRIAGKEIPFWILVDNKIPTTQETYAVAATTNPENGRVVYYPRTKATETKVLLATTNIKTKILERAIKERKEADQARGVTPKGEHPRIIR